MTEQFWILSGETKENQETIYIPLTHVGYQEPSSFELIDIFQVDQINEQDLSHVEGDATAVERTILEASKNVSKSIDLELHLGFESLTASKKVEKLLFNKPFDSDVSFKTIAKRLETKNKKLSDSWKGYSYFPAINYSTIKSQFSVTLPPHTSMYCAKQEYWSLFGLENKARNLDSLNTLSMEQSHEDSEDEGNLETGSQFDTDTEAEDEEQADDTGVSNLLDIPGQALDDTILSSNDTAGEFFSFNEEDLGQLEEDEIAETLENIEGNRPEAKLPKPKVKRALDDLLQFGFRNTTSKPKTWTGQKRRGSTWSGAFLSTSDRLQLSRQMQIRFSVEQHIPSTSVTQSRTITDPHNFVHIFASFKDMLENVFLQYNMPATMLTVNELYKRFNFVSYVTNSKTIMPLSVTVRLSDLTSEVTGLPLENIFQINPYQPKPMFFDVKTMSIETPVYTKPIYEENTSVLRTLPPTTSIMLTSSEISNTTFANSANSFMLAYLTAEGKLISTNQFTFKGQTNYITVEFFNQQTNAFMKWKSAGKLFKFVFKKIA